MKRLRDYVSRKELTFPNVLDHQSEVAGKYGVRGVPMNVFINLRGQIVGYASGYRKWDSQKGYAMIEQLLQESRYKAGFARNPRFQVHSSRFTVKNKKKPVRQDIFLFYMTETHK